MKSLKNKRLTVKTASKHSDFLIRRANSDEKLCF